jgi:TfoX/Sxy family transcriptional regulator of competence genes
VSDDAERFDELLTFFAPDPRIRLPEGGRGFGSNALRVDGKIFAMFVRGRLVVKLPKVRVDALVDSGEGVRFDANKGTPMKEWVSLHPGSMVSWQALAQEARDFVGPG